MGWTEGIRLGGLAGLLLVLFAVALYGAYRAGCRTSRGSLPMPETGSSERQEIAELHRRILATLPEYFLLVDLEGRLLKVNRKLAEAAQRTPASLVDRSIGELAPELSGTVLARASQGPIHNHRARLRTPKGPPLQLRWNLSPLLGDPGEPVGILGLGRDERRIHEIQRLEDLQVELRARERINLGLASTTDLRLLVNELDGLLPQYLGCDGICLTVRRESNEEGFRHVLREGAEPFDPLQTAFVDRCLTKLLEHPATLQIDPSHQDDSQGLAADEAGMGRCVATPLQVAEEQVGMVLAYRIRALVEVGETARRLARIAPQLALAVRNCRAFGSEHRILRSAGVSQDALLSMLEDMEEVLEELRGSRDQMAERLHSSYQEIVPAVERLRQRLHRLSSRNAALGTLEAFWLVVQQADALQTTVQAMGQALAEPGEDG